MDGNIADKIFQHLIKMEDRINGRFEQIQDKITDFKDGIHTELDQVMGELIKIREEQSLSEHRITHLEERVETIEKIPVIAHTIKK